MFPRKAQIARGFGYCNNTLGKSEWLSPVLFTMATTVTWLRVMCEVRTETEDADKE